MYIKILENDASSCYIQQNLNFGLNSSLSSITSVVVDAVLDFNVSSGRGSELMLVLRISIGVSVDRRIVAILKGKHVKLNALNLNEKYLTSHIIMQFFNN